MRSSNYLIDFLYQVDVLISEINKLNSKIRLYQKNSELFGIAFDVRFSILPDCFVKLRDFLQNKIEDGSCYDRDIVNLKRSFSKEFTYIMLKIGHEIARIDALQEKEMNGVVYGAVYKARYENEIELRNSYYLQQNSIFDRFLGIAKYRKLMIKNHDLKAKLVVKEYEERVKVRKSIFELVCMIENENLKSGKILCLQDEIIKAFMIDRNVVKRSEDYSWKKADLLPSGVFETRAYYKVLNKNIALENDELEKQLCCEFIDKSEEKSFSVQKLVKLNSKLSKILKVGIFSEV